MLALLCDVLEHLGRQLSRSIWAQTDKVLGSEFMQVEHDGIVQNTHKQKN